MDLPNIIGIIGAIATMAEYALVSTGRWSSNEPRYQIANIISTAMILYSLFYAWNLPSVVMQCLWIFLSFVGLVRGYIKRRRKQEAA